ncbi:hypothetical protein PIROE2DRAFT_60941 [Piromyces sp. E2]|nr:hypothetical protein PIROE2DRAFT_60941 [Piromyces sp. E2]|eukprot:OUM64034.1 hypothetical protein PIROE2DRAFT_60941 [Piromyces sp. E2]
MVVFIIYVVNMLEGKKHVHIYVQYENTKRISIPRIHGAHIEKCFGSAQKNIAYVKAEDQKHKDEGITSILWDEEGYLEDLGRDEVSELPAIFYNTWNKIKNQRASRLSIGTWRKTINVYYIQGPSAIGKSERAEEIIKNYYNDKGIDDPDMMFFDELKYNNGFYMGVNELDPCKVAVFDDFRAGVMKPEEFINLIDYRVHNMNIKGGQVKNRYELIIFTSVQKLNSIYRNVDEFERREQWERRIQLINLYPPERVHLGGRPLGYRTEFNQLEEYEVTDDWDGTRTIIN